MESNILRALPCSSLCETQHNIDTSKYYAKTVDFYRFYMPFWITCIILLCVLTTAYVFVRKNVSSLQNFTNPHTEIFFKKFIPQRHRYEGHSRSNEIQMVFEAVIFIIIIIFILFFDLPFHHVCVYRNYGRKR